MSKFLVLFVAAFVLSAHARPSSLVQSDGDQHYSASRLSEIVSNLRHNAQEKLQVLKRGIANVKEELKITAVENKEKLQAVLKELQREFSESLESLHHDIVEIINRNLASDIENASVEQYAIAAPSARDLIVAIQEAASFEIEAIRKQIRETQSAIDSASSVDRPELEMKLHKLHEELFNIKQDVIRQVSIIVQRATERGELYSGDQYVTLAMNEVIAKLKLRVQKQAELLSVKAESIRRQIAMKAGIEKEKLESALAKTVRNIKNIRRALRSDLLETLRRQLQPTQYSDNQAFQKLKKHLADIIAELAEELIASSKQIIRKRLEAKKQELIAKIIGKIQDRLTYDAGLEEYSDWETRIENVKEEVRHIVDKISEAGSAARNDLGKRLGDAYDKLRKIVNNAMIRFSPDGTHYDIEDIEENDEIYHELRQKLKAAMRAFMNLNKKHATPEEIVAAREEIEKNIAEIKKRVAELEKESS